MSDLLLFQNSPDFTFPLTSLYYCGIVFSVVWQCSKIPFMIRILEEILEYLEDPENLLNLEQGLFTIISLIFTHEQSHRLAL